MPDETGVPDETPTMVVRPILPGKLRWAIVGIVSSCVILCVITLVVSVEIGNARVRQFCALVAATDDAYQQAPPDRLGPTGQRLAAATHALRLSLDCPKESKP